MNSTVLKSIKINKRETEVTTQINKKGKKNMTLKDIKNITEAITKKGKSEYEYFDLALIRILNGDRWATYNTMDSYLAYYEGKVKDTTKFTNDIKQLQITTYLIK
jgi:hypothetical protein